MEKTPIEERKQDILRLLKEKRLNEAFARLKQIVAETSNWQLADNLEKLEQSYRYMIRYMAEGADDPQRNAIHESITAKAYELADMAAEEIVAQTSPKLYYATLRTRRINPSTLGSLLDNHRRAMDKIAVFDEQSDTAKADSSPLLRLLREKEAAESDIFRQIWTSFPTSADDIRSIRLAMADPARPETLKELMAGAMLMNLMEHYNEPLLSLLLDTYASAETKPSLGMKSLCCALIAMRRHAELVAHSKEVEARFADLADSASARADVMTVFLQFIRSRSTERIRRKVQDELVPKIMKLSPEIRRKLQGSAPSDETDGAEMNPDWQEMLDKSGITKKMQELNKLQIEGSDVFLDSFSRLKNFPFFSDIANWFRPFDPRHSSVAGIFSEKGNTLLTMVDRSQVFCDSDKYSFGLSVAGVPPQQRAMMLSQFDDQNAQIMQEADDELPDPQKQRENIANKYVQNLYRFFNLFRRKEEFYNPFAGSRLNLFDTPFVSGILSDAKSLRLIAEFYFTQECYADALSIFRKIPDTGVPPSADLYQKTGFCLEALKRFPEAVENYERVDLMKPDDPWTLKHLAACHRATGNTKQAIASYKRAEVLQPDNIAVANSIANCLLEEGRPEEALKYFFKVDYMANQGARTLRPIAWCSFLTADFAQSVDYYDRIIADAPTADDYINRGHALLCRGQVKEAVESYLDAVRTKDGCQPGTLIRTIGDDRPYLDKAGVDPTLTAIILDHIRYSFPQNGPETGQNKGNTE